MTSIRLLLVLISTWTVAAQDLTPRVVWVKTNNFLSVLALSNGTLRAVQESEPYQPRTRDLVRLDQNATIIERITVRSETGAYLPVHPSTDGYFAIQPYNGPDGPDAGCDNVLLKFTDSGELSWTNYVTSYCSGYFSFRPLADGGAIVHERGRRAAHHISASGATMAVFNGVSDVLPTSDGYIVWNYYEINYSVSSYDHSGRQRWSRQFGGIFGDELGSVAVSSDGRSIFLGGTSYSPAGEGKESPLLGRSDGWIVHVDRAGEKIWDTSLGDHGDDSLSTLGIVSNILVAAGGGKIVTLNMQGQVQGTIKYATSDSPGLQQISAISATDFLIWGQGGSDIARVHVPTLAIDRQPTDQSVLVGSSATFEVGALSPYAPARYQWYFGDQALAGETNSSLTIPSVQNANFGTYSALVANSTSTNRTRAATLAITDAELTIRMHPSLEIKGHLNRRYVIERMSRPDQANNTWEVADTIVLTNSPQIWMDTSLQLPDQRLYRARLEE